MKAIPTTQQKAEFELVKQHEHGTQGGCPLCDLKLVIESYGSKGAA